MKKKERFFYFSIIIAEALVVLFLSFQLIKTKNSINKKEDVTTYSSPSSFHLYSFYGTSGKGVDELIHFTAYSNKFFIMVVVSPQCGQCESVFKESTTFISKNQIDDDIEFIFLTSDLINSSISVDFKYLHVSKEDIFQFGLDTPTFVVVDGKGNILLKRVGYYEGLFEDCIDSIYLHKQRKGKSKMISKK